MFILFTEQVLRTAICASYISQVCIANSYMNACESVCQDP